ncbi:MAG: TlpA family protein disulfide reductase, partial [Sphingobacteriales bacterium]
YKKLDSNKIAFLGIAVDDKEQLKKYIEKEKILWPQILSNEENKIKDIYNIDSYPTTLLIDPNGKIIAKNLRGEDLAKKL